MTPEQVAQLAERDEQIAFLADQVAALKAAEAAPAPSAPPLDLAVAKAAIAAAVDREMAKLRAHFSDVTAQTAAAAEAVTKSTSGAGGDLLAEALGIARTEAQEAADAASGPKTAGYWKRALVALGEKLAPDMPPSSQMQTALRSEEGKLLLASMERNVGQGKTQ